MTDREAIDCFRYCITKCHDCFPCAEHDEALVVALFALQESEKRTRGCEFCNVEANKNAMVEDHGYAVCPYCGRPLKGADNER